MSKKTKIFMSGRASGKSPLHEDENGNVYISPSVFESHSKLKIWFYENWHFLLFDALIVTLLALLLYNFLVSYYYVEQLEYVNVDFEWIDDFQNYEVVINYDEQPHYLTVNDAKVKFVYTTDDFLNFVVVDHEKRIMDGTDKYSVKHFYINLNYKEVLE